MRFSEQTGYILYDKNGNKINCPPATVQGLIFFANQIYGKTLYTKIISENECVLVENLGDVMSKNFNTEKIIFRIYGQHKSCCS